MILPIKPLEVNGVVCTSANTSIAISDSVAIRIVPRADDGTEFPEAAVGVVGTRDQADIAAFMDAVALAAEDLLEYRGI